jgi:hypothetical protein
MEAKMIRYHVRDLGKGFLEAGGINLDGAAAFTEIVQEFAGVTITNIASISDPTAPVVRFPNTFDGGHEGRWNFFSTAAGGINKDGVIVGTAETSAPNGAVVPTVAIQAAQQRLLRGQQPTPLSGFSSSRANDIGNDGTVVGECSNEQTSVATVWRNREPVRIDGGLASPLFSRTVAINNVGTALGFFRAVGGGLRGFLHDANGGVEPDVGPTGMDAFPSDINDGGRVVGSASDNRGWFSQRSGMAMRLALLPGTTTSGADGVNNLGAIVGACDGTACLWDEAIEPTMAAIDLNARSSTPDNGRLHRAVRINDSGLILCQGSSDLGQRRIYLLSPFVAMTPTVCAVSDQTLFSFQPRGGIFGVNLPCRSLRDGGIPQGALPVSKLCQLVSALDCPGCFRLVDAMCGDGWGIGVEGVPDGLSVSLYAGSRRIGDLRPGAPRGDDDKPFTSKAGKRVLEIVFKPNAKHEYFLMFDGSKKLAKPEAVFPVRLTIFRDHGDAGAGVPKAPGKPKAPAIGGKSRKPKTAERASSKPRAKAPKKKAPAAPAAKRKAKRGAKR